MNEEKMRILKMLEEGKINAEEAARLLKALESARGEEEKAAKTRTAGRWFRIRVTDLHSGKQKVNVNIPLSLVNLGFSLGARFSPKIEGVDLDQIWESIKAGAQGKIVDVEDEEDGERVEIYID
ncbi:MAG: hypothetical protein DRI61_06700 [Chloroflexi bacterium]|nr:MAG: hypothetical protein DRI61_06700 [Chloroflexota bacterium]HDN80118.1 hypothetical protein [Chloroflexota bacterium]